MGLIRYILAFSVLMSHSALGVKLMPPGAIAVQLFFIISGFYMSMILNTKYKSHTVAFYKNRLLRLYPIYFSVLLIVITIGISSQLLLGESLNNWNAIFVNFENGILSAPSAIFLIISNLSMLFQDLIMFLRLQNGAFVLGHFNESSPPIYTMLLIPQAWSLSLEIMFYAIAPFIIKNRKRTLIAIIVSISIRVFLHILGYYYDPFSFRFFPSEASVFLLGSLSWHIYQTDKFELITKEIIPIQIGLILVFVFWPHIFQFSDLGRYLFFLIFAFMIPYFYEHSKNNSLDNKIAELSYPFYLVHFLSIRICSFGVSKILGHSIQSEVGTIVIATILATLISIMLLTFVQSHFERLRHVTVQKMIS